MNATTFAGAGYAIVAALLSRAECTALCELTQRPAGGSAGSRNLLALEWCAALACRLRAEPLLAPYLPREHVAVQCTFFEKSADRNWLVPVHQDLSVPVAERVADPSLQGWSEKEGQLFVQPPLALLEQLVAVRLHLDDCGADDGPLRVIPGSHRAGRVNASDAASARHTAPEVVCTVDAGGALVMRPLLLHASSKGMGASRRRVLHFLFGPPTLPCGLRWPLAT